MAVSDHVGISDVSKRTRERVFLNMSEEIQVSAPENQKGPLVEKVANNVTPLQGLMYGVGIMMFSAYNQMFTSYRNYFLTDAVGLDPITMGQITSWTGAVTWVWVFIAALIVEKVWFRWGQYRSYLLLTPALGFIFTLGSWTDWAFLGVETGSTAQVMLISVTYLIGEFFINLFMVAVTGLIPAVAHTEADRNLMSSRKAQCQLVIKLIFAALSLPMIIFFSGGDPTSNVRPDTVIGYTITATIWGISFVLSFLMLFFMFKGKDPTEEFCRKRYEAKKRGEKFEIPENQKIEQVSIGFAIKCFFTNIPALGLWLGEVGRGIYIMVLQSLAVYYCTAVYDEPMLYASMMTIANVVGMVGCFAGEFTDKYVGARRTYLIGCVLLCLGLLGGYFFAAVSKMWFTVMVCVCFFGANFIMTVEFTCMSNAIAWQEYKQGKTAKAFIMGTIQWCPQIGRIAQGIIVGAGLAAIGYTADVQMTGEIVKGISALTFLAPLAIMIVTTILFFFMHRLTTEQVIEANAELERRRIEKAQAALVDEAAKQAVEDEEAAEALEEAVAEAEADIAAAEE